MLALPIVRQVLAFGVIGGIQLLLDWAVFVLTSAAGVPVWMANFAGRIAGAMLGFWLNGRVTFQGQERLRLVGRPLRRFGWMWLGLTAVSTLVVSYANALAGLDYAWLAKPFIEALLAVASFVICRYWVYR